MNDDEVRMSLAEIAEALKLAAQSTREPAQHKLSRGLVLTLQYKPVGKWTLSMTRAEVAPSATEERICQEAFDIPSDQATVWYITRVVWQEEGVLIPKQSTFEGMEPQPISNYSE